MATLLLDKVDVDTDGNAVTTVTQPKVLVVWATSYGSGTVSFQISPDSGATWITPSIGGTPCEYTADVVTNLPPIGQGMQVRAVLTGSSGANDVSAAIYEYLA
jgi:hypothetical protein